MISDNNGKYMESNSSSFPSSDKYIFNSSKSGCLDSSGNVLDNSIKYDNNIVTYEMDLTSECYIYFDYVSLTDCSGTIGECLLENPTAGLNTSLEGGLYRFQGTNDTVNNFVCFGTTSKEECLSDTDKYMYRIIGINEDNQVKLIKKEALNTAYAWHSDRTIEKSWSDSDLYKGINGSYFLNTDYVPSDWNNKIAYKNWKYGKTTTINYTAANLYEIENNWIDTTSAKIGLMYTHDYFYAYQSGGLNCSSSGLYNVCKNAWIHLLYNDSDVPTLYEWTMIRYGLNGSSYHIWNVRSDGYVGYYYSDVELEIRPVFFLTSDVQYKSGTGTIENPILIQ